MNRQTCYPFSRSLLPAQGLLESVFDEVLRPRAARHGALDWSPLLSVLETEEAYLVEVELPGVDPTLVDLSFKDGVLTIAGDKARAPGEPAPHVAERHYGPFSRRLQFSHAVEATRITAESRHGVLSVRVPKTPLAKPLQIQIQTLQSAPEAPSAG